LLILLQAHSPATQFPTHHNNVRIRKNIRDAPIT
jgi:hypothetical protein